MKTGKEIAYIAVFVAFVIAAQLSLSAIPGVELVTVFFIVFSFSLGGKRGIIAATVFSLLRQLLFGFYPSVLLLYLLYYNLLAILFGWLGNRVKTPKESLWWLTLVSCGCTVCFTLFDCLITPLWYGFSLAATKQYFLLAVPFALLQVACTALTVSVLFLPLYKVFSYSKKGLK